MLRMSFPARSSENLTIVKNNQVDNNNIAEDKILIITPLSLSLSLN